MTCASDQFATAVPQRTGCLCLRGVFPAVLLVFVLSLADGRAAPPGPDNPRKHYWLRIAEPEMEVGATGTILQELAHAFGAGRYQESRGLAEHLLSSADSIDVRSQAMAYVIASYLAEGNFGAASNAAGRFNETVAAARIGSAEAEYRDQVSALEKIANTSDDPTIVARAKLAAGHVEERFGHIGEACRLYGALVADGVDEALAAAALSRLINIDLQRDGPAATRSTAFAALETRPGSAAVARVAAQGIAMAYLVEGRATAGMHALRGLAESTHDLGLRQAIAAAMIDLTYAPLQGAVPSPDDSRLPRSLVHATWALRQLPQGPDRARACFHLAWYNYDAENFEEAFRLAAEAVASPHLEPVAAFEAYMALKGSAPETPVTPETQAWMAIARVRMKSDDWLGYQPQRAQEWWQVAQTLDALAHTERVDSPWAPIAAAECYLDAHAPDEAARLLQYARDRWPHTEAGRQASVKLAFLLTQSGHPGEAVVLCHEILSSKPTPETEVGARRELARARLCGGAGPDALSDYYQQIQSSPSSQEAQAAVRILAELSADCLDRAAADDLLVRLASDYTGTPVAAMAQYELVTLRRPEALTTDSARDYLSVIRHWPDSEAAVLAAATLRERASDLVPAFHDIYARGEHSDVVDSFADLAVYLNALPQSGFQDILDQVILSARTNRHLADKAKSAIASAMELPDVRKGADRIALLCEAQANLETYTGCIDDARRLWERILSENPDSPYAARSALHLGDCYLDEEKPSRAINAYRHARGATQHLSDDERAWAMVGLGLALEALDRIDEAAFEYAAARAIAPGSTAAQAADSALTRLETRGSAW